MLALLYICLLDLICLFVLYGVSVNSSYLLLLIYLLLIIFIIIIILCFDELS